MLHSELNKNFPKMNQSKCPASFPGCNFSQQADLQSDLTKTSNKSSHWLSWNQEMFTYQPREGHFK